MRTALSRFGLALASLAAILASSSIAPAGTMAATTAATASGAADSVSLDWRSCLRTQDSRVRPRCTWISVPRDWAKSLSSGTYRIRVARIAAKRDRIGVLTFNPGGPGGAGVNLLHHVYNWLPPQVRDRFDIVAWDPRGVGQSEPALQPCTWDPPHNFPRTGPVDVAAIVQEWFAATVEANETCAAINAEHVNNLGTWQVIRDLDAIRSALGEQQITLWGMSYGTTVGRAYAQQFPSRLRGLVLDGAIDPAPSIHSYMREHIWSDLTAVERMLGALGGHYYRTYQRAMKFLDEQVLTFDGAVLTRWEFVPALKSLATREATWPTAMGLLDEVRVALRDPRERTAERGKHVADLAAIGQSPIESRGHRMTHTRGASPFDPTLGFVNCSDMHDRPTAESLAGAAREAVGVGGAPYLLPVLNEGAQCAGLPPLGQSLPGLTTTLRLSPRPVIINAVADNATPYLGARALANAFANAPMIVYDGTQHVSYGRTSGCIDRPVSEYIVSLTLPPQSTTCPLSWRKPS